MGTNSNYIDLINKNGNNHALLAYNMMIINNQGSNVSKTVSFRGDANTLPNGDTYADLCFKILFTNGHVCQSSSDYMKLNNIYIKKYKSDDSGELEYLPIITDTSNNTTTYTCLKKGTVLELYYDGTQFICINNSQDRLLDAHPVGSLYWSEKSTDPSILFGGTWSPIKDRFVLARGDIYTSVNSTGGSSTVTLTSANLPKHNHTFTPQGTVNHRHGLSNDAQFIFDSGSTDGHQLTAKEIPAHTHSVAPGAKSGTGGLGIGNYNFSHYNGSTTGSAFGPNDTSSDLGNSHSHEILSVNAHISGYTDTANVTLSGTQGTTSDGNFANNSFSILPPYIVEYCWKRTA